ncbi:hypothetical protein NBRC10512_007533 [Rhodotorula toruloides]|uniref:RHTO0S09e06832g1_1 n=2 Tax=Rhodotorula toruloides TaxID=5286 RepID=A0A061B497_RHOTO|nr:uncharacterized protein RHTO_03950 [Rhodotorula toruloides NP11]EMS19906.1 hypothetical protein RHTO_03950 [Rhodotorula toruloides NP11]CDR44602.1 RHTO0S09e06832g1_1 [Rhodotorula toruloides]
MAAAVPVHAQPPAVIPTGIGQRATPPGPSVRLLTSSLRRSSSSATSPATSSTLAGSPDFFIPLLTAVGSVIGVVLTLAGAPLAFGYLVAFLLVGLQLWQAGVTPRGVLIINRSRALCNSFFARHLFLQRYYNTWTDMLGRWGSMMYMLALAMDDAIETRRSRWRDWATEVADWWRMVW